MNQTALRKSGATRDRIVEAAYQLFLAQGYHATTMRQIVQRAGVTMGGIYAHFPSKAEIWQTVFIERHPFRTIIPIIQAAQGVTVSDVFHDAAHRLVMELGQHPDFLNLMLIEIVEFNGENFSRLFDLMLPEFLKIPTLFAEKQGKLRDIPAPILARAFFGLFISYFLTEYMIPEKIRPIMGDHALDQFVDIFLNGAME